MNDLPAAAIFLCAGYGTRMRELGEKPKPLIEVGGRPMLDYLLEAVAGLAGIEEVHVATNSRFAAAFTSWAASRWRPELPIRVHDDGSSTPETRLGAVGDLDFVLERAGIPEGGALVSAGDNIFLFELTPFWRDFRDRGACRVLALEERDPSTLRRTGVLELAGERVLRLHEKPAEPPSCWACPSIYALTPEALALAPAFLAAGHGRDEIGRFIAWLAEQGEVAATEANGDRLHVGSPEELAQAEAVLRARAL